MTTQSWSSALAHTTDAEFRTWGSELSTKLAAAGLVQTADTGQVNWVTVLRPAANTEGGYEIWRMNDAQQGTAPVYFRIGYGTASGATQPRLQITIGTASNGTGTITGTALSTARTITVSGAPGASAYQSYLCVTSGFFGLIWKVSANAAEVGYGSFFFARSVDTTGTPSATGGMALWGIGSQTSVSGFQFLRFAATASITTNKTLATQIPCVIPGQPASSLTAAGNIQAYIWYMAIPDVVPLHSVASIVATEISRGSTFTTTLVGSSSHTYISVGIPFIPEPGATTTYGIAMLWE